jgi:hypothetical protein
MPGKTRVPYSRNAVDASPDRQPGSSSVVFLVLVAAGGLHRRRARRCDRRCTAAATAAGEKLSG